MKNRQIRSIAAPLAALFLTLAGGTAIAASDQPMTPELAAKRERVRIQEEQRVTQEEKQAAADALKALRLKIYKARQAEKKLNPGRNDQAK